MGNMKKLLQEFKKNILNERSFPSSKFGDAIDIIKFFVESGVESGSPESHIVSEIQQILNFAKLYDDSPGLETDSAEQIAIAQTKISDKFVQQQIHDILVKMGMEESKISNFINYINQKVESPDEIRKAAINLKTKESAEDSSQQQNISNMKTHIKPANVVGTVFSRTSKSK